MTRSEGLELWRKRCLVTGGVALAALGLGGVLQPEQIFRSYLYGFLPWLGLSLGALAVLMLQHVITGEWGFIVRRFLEAATKNLPLMAVFFIPVALGVHALYPWTDGAGAEHPELLAHKSPYLNVPFFLARSVLYFAIWIFLARRLTRLSERQDRGERALVSKLQSISGPGLVIYGLTITFASIDWVMSLDYVWYSTIYGMLFVTGQCLSALAFSALSLYAFSTDPAYEGRLGISHFHGLGNMLLAFVMLWGYVHFSQYLIIWSGNLPEGIRFYLNRSHGWVALLLVLVALHFAVPFLLLLSRSLKQGGTTLAGIAGVLFLLRFVDNYWLVAPSFYPEGFQMHWMDVAAPVGIGGIWLWAYGGHLSQLPLLPLADPRFPELAPGAKSHEVYGHG